MPRSKTKGFLFLVAVVLFAVLAATELSHRNGAASLSALPVVEFPAAPGIFLLMNKPNPASLEQYPLTLQEFLKKHADQDCVLVGDYTVGNATQGHYFRCTCRVPDPCENGAIHAQELTTE